MTMQELTVVEYRVEAGKGLLYSVSHIWSHSWRAEGHTMSDQANDSTQSPHHRMQNSHSKRARPRCSRCRVLDLSGVRSHTAVC